MRGRPAKEKILSHAARKPDSLENRLLGGLSRKEYARIARDLQYVTLKADQLLYEPGGMMQWAYFLDTASVSILSEAENGTSIEVSLVGSEGVIGIPIVLRAPKLPYRKELSLTASFPASRVGVQRASMTPSGTEARRLNTVAELPNLLRNKQ